MRVLFIEDEERFIDGMRPELVRILGEDGVTFARSRNGAITALSTHTYDLVILDQRIPSDDGNLDATEVYGRFVFDAGRSLCIGTPVWFLTAFGMDDFIEQLLARADKCDLWGSRNEEQLVCKFSKQDADKFLDQLFAVRVEVDALNGIEVRLEEGLDRMDPQSKRVLRIWARRLGGQAVDVRHLSGGLSGVKVLRVTARDEANAVRMIAATKIGELPEIEREKARYDPEVKRLNAGDYAPLVDFVHRGAANKAGLFYRLMEEEEENFFSVLSRDATSRSNYSGSAPNSRNSVGTGSAHAEEDIR